MSEGAAKTPLVDQLRAVPEDAVAWYMHGATSHSQIPYGRHCRDALAEIERLTEALDVDIERENSAFAAEANEANESGYREGYREGFNDGRNS